MIWPPPQRPALPCSGHSLCPEQEHCFPWQIHPCPVLSHRSVPSHCARFRGGQRTHAVPPRTSRAAVAKGWLAARRQASAPTTSQVKGLLAHRQASSLSCGAVFSIPASATKHRWDPLSHCDNNRGSKMLPSPPLRDTIGLAPWGGGLCLATTCPSLRGPAYASSLPPGGLSPASHLHGLLLRLSLLLCTVLGRSADPCLVLRPLVSHLFPPDCKLRGERGSCGSND